MSHLGPHASGSVPAPRVAAEHVYPYCLEGESAAIRRVRSQLHRIAPYFRTALILGEDGIGKETVARTLHERSAGIEGRFAVWRRSDLFSYLRQEQPKHTLSFDMQRGTLFLEGIDDLPIPLQDRLLRIFGTPGSLGHRSQTRIVAASRRPLRTLVTAGQFREELYRTLGAVEIVLVPLRRRPEDLPSILKALSQSIPALPDISPAAIARLGRHHWPGNLRELRAVLEHAANVSRGEPLEPRHLPFIEAGTPALSQPGEHKLERLQDVVQRHVLDVLTRCSGNKLRASEVLGISRSTLYRMLDACAAGVDPGLPG